MHNLRRSVFSALIAAVLVTAANGADVAKELKSLTGAPTRLVWCQATINPNDFCALTPTFKLCGFDTEDAVGERYILSEVASYAKPMFTPDGQRVVYSNRSDKMIYVVNWDGSGKRKVTKGFASDVWRDSATGIDWIYYRSGNGGKNEPVVRCRLDNPEINDHVWNPPTGHDNVPWFQLSADGKRAGDAFPWSACGVANLSNKSWKQYGGGCWPSMAPDNSYRFFHFLGDHKTVAMFDADGKNRRVVGVNGHENIHNRDIYFPQWTNSAHFLTVTGPGIGGHQSELYIGKFDQAYSAVEKWVRVTFNDKGDFYGDAWVKSAAPVARYPAKASAEERKALDELSDRLQGAVVYCRAGRVKKVLLGIWEPVDLGEGDFVRWGPRGERLAVIRKGAVYVMNADGSNRKKLISGGVTDQNCPLEFHTNGREIIYCVGRSVRAVNIESGATREFGLPYDSEPGISADGRRLVGRLGAPYAAELPGTKHRKYADGCSPGISPDGRRLMNNTGSHKTMEIRNWNGSNQFLIDNKTCRPDKTWDNQHWSNHNDYITIEGENGPEEAYVFCISENKGTRVTWEGHVRYPDLYVAQGQVVETVAEPQVAAPPKDIPLEGWPVNSSGLVFLWENSSKTNQIVLAGGKAGRTCRVAARGKAIFSRYFDMDLTGGSFLADGVDAELLDACRRSNQLTIESVVTSASLQQSGPARIVTFSSDPSSRNFTLGQDGNRLILRLRTPQTGTNGTNPQIDLCTIEAGKTYHIIVSYLQNLLTCYVNGEQVLVTDKLQGDFSNWGPAHLLFGDEWTGGRDWHGRLEGVAIYSRFIDQPEAKKHWELYAAKVKNRKPLPKLAVQAKLVKITPTPKPQDVAPYRRCLVDYVYEIEKVLDGKCAERKIMVSHWGILDAKVIPINRAIGKSYRLSLEVFDKHPELDGERRVSDIDDFDLSSYLDIER